MSLQGIIGSQLAPLAARNDDSLFSDVDDTTRSTIQGMFSCSITITMPNVQKQKGTTDCGLFAVAFATTLASERKFETLLTKFDQDNLRSHLCVCLENQNIVSFPLCM